MQKQGDYVRIVRQGSYWLLEAVKLGEKCIPGRGKSEGRGEHRQGGDGVWPGERG